MTRVYDQITLNYEAHDRISISADGNTILDIFEQDGRIRIKFVQDRVGTYQMIDGEERLGGVGSTMDDGYYVIDNLHRVVIEPLTPDQLAALAAFTDALALDVSVEPLG